MTNVVNPLNICVQPYGTQLVDLMEKLGFVQYALITICYNYGLWTQFSAPIHTPLESGTTVPQTWYFNQFASYNNCKKVHD